MLRKKLAVLLAMVMMLTVMSVMSVMSVSPALVHQDVALAAKLDNSGNKSYDGPDHNQGGGQEKPKKAKHANG